MEIHWLYSVAERFGGPLRGHVHRTRGAIREHATEVTQTLTQTPDVLHINCLVT